MNLKLSFSLVGLVAFALPMLINVAYAVFFPFREDMTGKNDSEPRRRRRQTRIGEV